MSLRDAILERDVLPDPLVRAGIRQILRQRLREERERDEDGQRMKLERFVAQLRSSPIAVQTGAANAQHYEVPAEFFELVLGPRMKYSCGLWDGHDLVGRSHPNLVGADPCACPELALRQAQDERRRVGPALQLAEDAMLAVTCERAELADGQHILELGCGWGSLTLYMAERFPCARIVAVSNSV